mgnify:CR=1 FL=1
MVIKRYAHAAPRENAVMPVKIPVKLEVPGKAGVMQHAPGITAHGELPAGFDKVMFVQHESMRMMRNRAAIDHRLAMILAGQFEFRQLEQPVGRRIKTDIAGFLLQLRIGDGDRTIINQTRIDKALRTCQRHKVVPVQCAAQAFAIQHRIIDQRLRNAPVAIDIGEV